MTRSDLETARLHELLATRATQGLGDAEAAELARLGDDAGGFEEAAAMIDLITLPREPLPAALADKIFAAATRSASATAPAVPAVPAFTGAALAAVPSQPLARSRARWPWVGWGVAALSATAALWLWRSQPHPAAEPPSVAALRSELAAAEDVLRVAGTDAGVTADVVWSARQQRGVLRIAGLGRNDPAKERYQIWIFDRARDERYPVDGGLFDVMEGETTVEVRPRVQIKDATGFWVTREAPAGAVVSDRAAVVLRTR